MRQFTVTITVLSILFLSLSLVVLAAPLPIDQPIDKRGSNNGRGTWFYDGLGACGDWNSNSDSIVAISAAIYGSGGNCGQWIRITNTDNWKTAYGLTRDECQACGADDLDMSIGLFEQLGDLNTGVLPINWNFMPVGWAP